MPKRNGGVIHALEKPAAKRVIFLSSIGEVVEWFDFMVYLSLAPVLAKVIFAPDDSSSLVMTLGNFRGGFPRASDWRHFIRSFGGPFRT